MKTTENIIIYFLFRMLNFEWERSQINVSIFTGLWRQSQYSQVTHILIVQVDCKSETAAQIII